jgi:hypothetical protein
VRIITLIKYSGRTGVCKVDEKVYRDIKAIVFREAPGWREKYATREPRVGDVVCGDVFDVKYALIDLRTGTVTLELANAVTVEEKTHPAFRHPEYYKELIIRPAGPAPPAPREVVEIAREWEPGHLAELVATKRRPSRILEADAVGFWSNYQELWLYRYNRARDYKDILEVYKYPEEVVKVEFLNARISPIWEWRGREVFVETTRPIYVPGISLLGEEVPGAVLVFFLISPWCNRVVNIEYYKGEPVGVYEDIVVEKWAVKKRRRTVLVETAEPLPSA